MLSILSVFLVAFAYFQVEVSAQQLGLCSPLYTLPDGACEVTTAFTVTADVSSEDFNLGNGLEVTVYQDFVIPTEIFATAVDTAYASSVPCSECELDGTSTFHPVTCTSGMAEVMVATYGDRTAPTFQSTPAKSASFSAGTGAQVAAVIYPGDRFISFNGQYYDSLKTDVSFDTTYSQPTTLRLGGQTKNNRTRIAVRFLNYDGWVDGTRSVTVTFHQPCSPSIPNLSVYAGYLVGTSGGAPLVGNVDVPQSRTGRISADYIRAILQREQVSSITALAVGFSGRDLLASATLWKISSNGYRTKWADTAEDSPVFYKSTWNQPSLEIPSAAWKTVGASRDLQATSLSDGDFLQWTCNYKETNAPPYFSARIDRSLPDSIPTDFTAYDSYACDVQIVFVNSRCGGAWSDGTATAAPLSCNDPLYVNTTQVAPPQQTHLVYDYRPSGECSDGGQWLLHPYRCTDQYNGGRCAYCTGRANNKEVHTCIERPAGMTCNAMFSTLARKSWCNMEFECAGERARGQVWIILASIAVVLLAFF